MITFRQFLENTENDYLYHATYKSYIKKIKKQGLVINPPTRNWEDSENVIYLATSPDVALSYAETSDEVPDHILDSGIVVLKIKKNKLDPTKLSIDKNVQDNEGDTLEYHQNIPPENLEIHSIHQN